VIVPAVERENQLRFEHEAIFAPTTTVPARALRIVLALLSARLVNPAHASNLRDALARVDGLPAVSAYAGIACDDGAGDRRALLAVATAQMHISSPLRVAHNRIADTDWLAAAGALALEPRIQNRTCRAQRLLEVRPHKRHRIERLVVGFGDI